MRNQAPSIRRRDLHYDDADGNATELGGGRYTRFTVTYEAGGVRQEINYFDEGRDQEPFATASLWDITRYDADGNDEQCVATIGVSRVGRYVSTSVESRRHAWTDFTSVGLCTPWSLAGGTAERL